MWVGNLIEVFELFREIIVEVEVFNDVLIKVFGLYI